MKSECENESNKIEKVFLSFRVRVERRLSRPPPASRSLSLLPTECLKELLRKQTSKTARQTDRLRSRQAGRQRVSHYVYAACDDDNKKHRLADAIKTEAASATPTRWHAPAVVFIWQNEIEKEREREGEIYLSILFYLFIDCSKKSILKVKIYLNK